MYVVRRSFKNFGEVMLPGSVVDPDSIKMFKTKLKDHVIIEVSAQNFDRWNEYFKNKFGVEIQVPAKNTEETQVTPENTDETSKAEETTQQVKPTVKVVVTAKN